MLLRMVKSDPQCSFHTKRHLFSILFNNDHTYPSLLRGEELIWNQITLHCVKKVKNESSSDRRDRNGDSFQALLELLNDQLAVTINFNFLFLLNISHFYFTVYSFSLLLCLLFHHSHLTKLQKKKKNL